MAEPKEVAKTLDGKPAGSEDPYNPLEGVVRGYLAQARQQSGGLEDDPTDSGAPVKNRESFTGLKGGR